MISDTEDIPFMDADEETDTEESVSNKDPYEDLYPHPKKRSVKRIIGKRRSKKIKYCNAQNTHFSSSSKNEHNHEIGWMWMQRNMKQPHTQIQQLQQMVTMVRTTSATRKRLRRIKQRKEPE